MKISVLRTGNFTDISRIVIVSLMAIFVLVRVGNSAGEVTEPDKNRTVEPQFIRVPSAVVKFSDSVGVPAEYTGVLTSVVVKEGQILRKGDLVARIRDSELRLRLERAEYENQIAKLTAENDVDIRFSEKSGQLAEAEVARSKRSNSRVKNSVAIPKLERQILERDRTKLQLEQARRDFKVATLKMSLTRNEVALSMLLLEKTVIRSPMDGMVVSVERSQGEWVESSETVVRIVQVDRLRVEGFVSAEDAGKITIGDKVEVEFSEPWLKGREYKGSICFVSPEANPVNSQILVWAEIVDPGNRLVSGLHGDILIETSSVTLSDRP